VVTRLDFFQGQLLDAVSGTPRLILRLEGLSVLVFAVVGYQSLHGSWLLFTALLLVPDIAMAGYVINSRVGAATYNVAHTYLGPGLLAAAGAALGKPGVWPVCIIWIAHIGLDRLLGFGLKYPTAFQHTHLGQAGSNKKEATAFVGS
jgi:hypothetical protein